MKVDLTHASAKTVAAAALNPATKSKLISEAVKEVKAAGDNKLPKTLQLLKTLNANSFGAEWNKEADTVRVWATGTQRPMQFRIVGQLDKAIKEDTGAKAVRVMPNTSWKPNSLELNGKLEKRD